MVRDRKIKVPVWDGLAGQAGPHPLPPLLHHTELGWGGGGGEPLMGRVLPGNFERGGLLWRIYLAGKNCDSIWRTKVATLFGGPKWRPFWAGQFGDSGGRVNLASLYSGFC